MGSTSMHRDGSNPAWNYIWCCRVPQKVRIFAWKLANNALAMQDNKVRRRLEEQGVCPICGQEEETTYHAML